jgi:hypothetical protein
LLGLRLRLRCRCHRAALGARACTVLAPHPLRALCMLAFAGSLRMTLAAVHRSHSLLHAVTHPCAHAAGMRMRRNYCGQPERCHYTRCYRVFAYHVRSPLES